jgi:WD40 repeat protein
MILTVGDEETARLWGARDGQQLAAFKHAEEVFHGTERISGAEFSPDGRRLTTFSNSNVIRIWDIKPRQQTLALRTPHSGIHSAVFSPDGRRILSTDQDGLALIWDSQTGRELGRIQGHDNLQIHALFSPNGKVILTYGIDKTAKLWDGNNGQPICTLVRHNEPILSGGFSPDGRLVVLSFNGVPRLTRVWLVDFLSEAQTCRPRDLTPEERARFELLSP